ncbi:MAG: hypothetical protein AAF441_08630 [Pseudomonadota bacterium]
MTGTPREPGSGARDFLPEVNELEGVAFGTGNLMHAGGPVADQIKAQGRWLTERTKRYADRYQPLLGKFFSDIMPADRPASVVYPFGGGDLVSCLLAFPDAKEITSLSLEYAGSPLAWKALEGEALLACLKDLHEQIGGTLSVGSNTSRNLSEAQANPFPVQLTLWLAALRLHGQVPTQVRYFHLRNDGTLKYLSSEAIESASSIKAKPLADSWTQPHCPPVFANVEIRYTDARSTDAPERIFRHITCNLHNRRFCGHTALQAHLKSKGKVAGLVKGASYHLWRDTFSDLRRYMLSNMPLILSDSSGIPTGIAVCAGHEIQTFGSFHGSFLKASDAHNRSLRDLWARNPHRPMPMRYGYVDCRNQPHLMISQQRPRTTSPTPEMIG